MKVIQLMFVPLCLFCSGVCASTEGEINHLLKFVESTSCRYERNGSFYTGKEALKHIKRKYRHFRDDIQTAEAFIELSATKSTMSGKYYYIHCNQSEPVRSKDWLAAELNRYRAVLAE